MTQAARNRATGTEVVGLGVTGVRSVAVYVDDLERAADFYVRSLGMVVQREDEPQPSFRTVEVGLPGGGTTITLVRPTLAALGADDAARARDRIGEPTGIVLEVADLETTRAELERRGIELVAGAGGPPWGREHLTFRDSSNNELALIEAARRPATTERKER